MKLVIKLGTRRQGVTSSSWTLVRYDGVITVYLVSTGLVQTPQFESKTKTLQDQSGDQEQTPGLQHKCKGY